MVSPPRIYPKLNRRLQLLMWLSLAGGLFLLGGGGVQAYQAWRLQTHGQQVEGTLAESSKTTTGKGRVSYRLTIDYTPQGADTGYRKEFAVAPEMYRAVQAAGRATVHYLPSQPETSALGDSPRLDLEPVAMGGGLLLVSAAIALYRRRQTRQLDRYLATG